MSKAGANSPQADLKKLLEEIDNAVSTEDVGKEARLTDAKSNLTALKADLIGLRRMLIQHNKPDAPVQELNGQTLGSAIRERIKQVDRLEDYINELEQLPDDPPPEDAPEAQANGDAGLRVEDTDDTLDDTEVVRND
jgi:hypothetical protein